MEKHLYEFGSYRLDARERLLLRGSETVPLTPKAYETLLALVENSGHLLEKEELMQRLWPDSFVEEGSLAQNISLLRKTLGESDNQKYIETVPRRGYRFVANVKEISVDASQAVPEPVEISLVPEVSTKVSQLENGATIGEDFARKPPATTGLLRTIIEQKDNSFAAILILAAAVLVTVGFFYSLTQFGLTSEQSVRSIAVLPFRSLSGDENDIYLGIGIAETLTTRLSSLRLLSVRPTSAVLRYAKADKETIIAGQELEVDAVLEGSIRRMGERVRVTTRLVSVRDGSLIWADRFDENFTDIFKVEDSISDKVAGALALKLSGAERARLTKRHTGNAEAYQLYLKGRYFWNKRTEDGFKRGLAHFKEAVALDSNYALAYAGLADSYIGLTFYSFAAPNETMPRAKEAALKALAIDHTLAEAHASLAHVLLNFDWNWGKAADEFQLSLNLNPNYATAQQWYAIHFLTAMGRLPEALERMKQALELEPASLVMNTFWGATLFYAGRYDEAIEQCRKTIEMDPAFAVAHWHLGLAYEQKGMGDEAIVAFQEAVALSGNSPLMKAALGHAYAKFNRRAEAARVLTELSKLSEKHYVPAFNVAAIYAALGDKERAFQLLEKAYQEHSFHLVYLHVWPQFDAIRTDARFQELGRRIGLRPPLSTPMKARLN